MISKGQSDFLNLTRWVAAALVVIEHARNLLFVDYGSLESPTLFHKGFYFLTGFGHESVVVFFVISGFLVGGKAWSLWREGKFGWRRYLADRISRLYSVLIVALLIGGVLDWVGASQFNSFGFYNHSTPENVAVVSEDFSKQISANHFFGNLLMLQKIKISTFGSNGPLWSLAHEWWYYLLFPLALFVWKGRWPARVICLVSLALLCWLLTPYILVLFGVWLLGVVAWWCNEKRILPWWATLIGFAGAMTLMRLEIELFPFAHQFLVGICFALLLNSFAQTDFRLPAQQASRWLADFSYSLYLIHFPVMLFVISIGFTWQARTTRMPLSVGSLACFLVCVLIAFVASYLVSLLTEARTNQFRAILYRAFGISVEGIAVKK